MEADKFLELTKKVEKLRQAKDRGVGSLQSLKTQLKKEFGVETLGEAKKLLKELNSELEQVSEEVERLETQFDEAYDDRLQS